MKDIYVTQPSLPPLDDFIPYLRQIWESRQLTNNGPFHQQLESALCDYLGVPFISLFNNGTQALITALQALDLTGEVITTPYTFVATSHAILWNRLTPVFVDIEQGGFNIDPAAVEAAITPNTCAILAVHCYGFPCQTDALQKIADKHGLKLIYDAAHAFGVENESGSILRHGDLSTLSFHATKVFNTLEGGAIVSHSKEMKEHIDLLKNFGIANETEVLMLGGNGKMNEVQAALGLLQLKSIDANIKQRQQVDASYRQKLAATPGIELPESHATRHNYSYFPILLKTDYPLSRDALYLRLKQHHIHSRRYFYPLTSDLLPYRDNLSCAVSLPQAAMRAHEVLCLPLHSKLDTTRIKNICIPITKVVSC